MQIDSVHATMCGVFGFLLLFVAWFYFLFRVLGSEPEEHKEPEPLGGWEYTHSPPTWEVPVTVPTDGVAEALGCEPGEELNAIARLIRECEEQRRRADAAHGRLNRYDT